MIKDKFNRSGKEQYRQLDTPKTEEKTTTVNTEGNKSEAPKKKKNILIHDMIYRKKYIRMYFYLLCKRCVRKAKQGYSRD